MSSYHTLNPPEAIILQMIGKGIDSDELFLYCGLVGGNGGGNGNLDRLMPIILQLASAGYLEIRERNIAVVGFQAILHSYVLTTAGQEKLEQAVKMLREKWMQITTAVSTVANDDAGEQQAEHKFQQLVAENEEWIYAMVMLEVARPEDAEAILRAAHGSQGSDSSDSQRKRDEMWQSVFSESLTNLLGSHVRYD